MLPPLNVPGLAHAANPGAYPTLTEQQLHKLKLLTVVSIAETQKARSPNPAFPSRKAACALPLKERDCNSTVAACGAHAACMASAKGAAGVVAQEADVPRHADVAQRARRMSRR